MGRARRCSAAARRDDMRTRLASPPRGEHSVEKSASLKSEARLIALLSAAHRRPVAPRSLAHIRRALVRRSEGETTLPLIHLALSGVSKLEHPLADARRLFMADGLMRAGIAPRVILQALELDTAPLDELERRYNPDQPRVPAGSGRESGQWTSGDQASGETTDAASQRSPSADERSPVSDHPVQIADSSPNWAQYLNPIGEAEAAETGRPGYSGRGPNDQHAVGVALAVERLRAEGYEILSNGATPVDVPGFSTPRVYDFIARDPATGLVWGMEVKTTMYDTIFLNPSQVMKDAAIYETGGGYAASLDEDVTRVGYIAYCRGCAEIDLRSFYLRNILNLAGIKIRTDTHSLP
jgi:hypothetical protein